MRLFFDRECDAIVFGMHLGLGTATNTRRDLSIVRIGGILIGRPIRGVPATMETVAEFVENKGRG